MAFSFWKEKVKRRHLQVRLVKDTGDQETTEKLEFPFEEVEFIVNRIFIGIAALMVLNTIGKIAVYKIS
jgi:hypothetical protein